MTIIRQNVLQHLRRSAIVFLVVAVAVATWSVGAGVRSAHAAESGEVYDAVLASDPGIVTCFSVRDLHGYRLGISFTVRKVERVDDVLVCQAASGVLVERERECLAAHAEANPADLGPAVRDCMKQKFEAREEAPLPDPTRESLATIPRVNLPDTDPLANPPQGEPGTVRSDSEVPDSGVIKAAPSEDDDRPNDVCGSGVNPALGFEPVTMILAIIAGLVLGGTIGLGIVLSSDPKPETTEPAPPPAAPKKKMTINDIDPSFRPDPEAESPCETARWFLQDCEDNGWKGGGCMEFADAIRGCDSTIAHTTDDEPCGSSTEDTSTLTPPSPTCSEVSRPVPGPEGDPCNEPEPDTSGARHPVGDSVDPCEGTNPYALTTEDACVSEEPFELPPVPSSGPTPDEVLERLGINPVPLPGDPDDPPRPNGPRF